MSARGAILSALALLGAAAGAVQPDEQLKDPVLEARAVALSKTLRCVVCQNQTIDDSAAPLARDMRLLVRERLQAGDSDEAVRSYLVRRYGNYVLLKPPLQADTYALWFGPFALLGLAALGALALSRARLAQDPTQPLSDEERERLTRALGEERSEPR